MKKIVIGVLVAFIGISSAYIHNQTLIDEERQAEEFANWVEANEDNIASFVNKDADYDFKWYLDNADNVHKYLEM